MRVCDSNKLFILRVWEKKKRGDERGEELSERRRTVLVERRSGFDFKRSPAPASHGDVGGLCQGETDGLDE